MSNTTKYTLGEAAKAVGKSKTTLHRAIKSGKISAARLDDKSYSIDPAELHRVFAPVTPVTVTEQLQGNTIEHPDVTPETLRSQLDMERKERERERQLMQDTIADLREDRDRWRQQATALIEDKRSTKIFKRIFGL